MHFEAYLRTTIHQKWRTILVGIRKFIGPISIRAGKNIRESRRRRGFSAGQIYEPTWKCAEKITPPFLQPHFVLCNPRTRDVPMFRRFFVKKSLSLSIYLSIYLSIFLYLYLYLSLYLYLYLSLFFSLSLSLSIYLSLSLFLSLSFYLYLYLYLSISISISISLYLSLYLYLYLYLSLYLSIYLSLLRFDGWVKRKKMND